MPCCPCNTTCANCGTCATLSCVWSVKVNGYCWTLNLVPWQSPGSGFCTFTSCFFPNIICPADTNNPTLRWTLASDPVGWHLYLSGSNQQIPYIGYTGIPVANFVCNGTNTWTPASISDACIPTAWQQGNAIVAPGDCGASQSFCSFTGCCCQNCRQDASGNWITPQYFTLVLSGILDTVNPPWPAGCNYNFSYLNGTYSLSPTLQASVGGLLSDPCCHYRATGAPPGWIFEFGIGTVCVHDTPTGGPYCDLCWMLILYQSCSQLYFAVPFGLPKGANDLSPLKPCGPAFLCQGTVGSTSCAWYGNNPCAVPGGGGGSCGGCGCYNRQFYPGDPYNQVNFPTGLPDPNSKATITSGDVNLACSLYSACAPKCGPLSSTIQLDTTKILLVNEPSCGFCTNTILNVVRGIFTLTNQTPNDATTGCGWSMDPLALTPPYCRVTISDDTFPLSTFTWSVSNAQAGDGHRLTLTLIAAGNAFASQTLTSLPVNDTGQLDCGGNNFWRFQANRPPGQWAGHSCDWDNNSGLARSTGG